jgi:hypothetical protein
MVRYNGIGMMYMLSEGDKGTIITNGANSITVDMPIAHVSQAWYNWQHKGVLLQNAFPQLDANQREFILTGITAEEWDKIFPPEPDRFSSKNPWDWTDE